MMQSELNLQTEISPERVFLGWDAPLVNKVVDYLWERRSERPQWMVVVPTAQSGRRLREMLAERGGCLAPKVVTPAFFFSEGRDAGCGLAESIAWEQTFESVDWSDFEDVIPANAAVAHDHAARGLIKQVQLIRAELADVDHDISRVAARLAEEHPEKKRWQALARLENRYRKVIKRLGFSDPQDSRRRFSQESLPPEGLKKLIIAGVPDPVPLSQSVWKRWQEHLPIEVLIHAPSDESESFDDWGIPRVDTWSERALAVGGNDVIEICEQPADQAKKAVRIIADQLQGKNHVSREDLTLGICDTAILPEVTRVFSERGWSIFDPAGKTLGETGFLSWLQSLCEWFEKDDIRRLSRILPQVWTERLLERKTYWLTLKLAQVVGAALPQTTEDLVALETAEWLDDKPDVQKSAGEVAGVCNSLNYWRNRFSIVGVAETLREIFSQTLRSEPEAILAIAPLLDEVVKLEKQTRLPASRWISLLGSALAHVRVESEIVEKSLDAQGWLELSYESAQTLILCGFNEGVVPESSFGDAWLPNAMRSLLELKDNRQRFARDAFYTTSLVESRKGKGSVTFILGRWTSGGESLKPSRLLLMPPRAELANRVKHTFTPSDVMRPVLPWTRDWRLAPPKMEPKLRLSPTAIAMYLKCPFRYYLKHVLGMQRPESLREEWSHREFGTVIHEVLERFGRDAVARDYSKTEPIAAWLSKELDTIVAERFTGTPPLAIEMQVESMRQRLGFFAREQAGHRANGWEIKEVEQRMNLEVAGVALRGIIDRIDYHSELDQWMVWDYKTGKDALDPKKAHCKPIGARTPVPRHLEGHDVFQLEAFARSNAKAIKPHFWTNLQLPLYAAWLWQEKKVQAGVGYISMMPTSSEIGFKPWADYSEDYTHGALAAATELAERLKQQNFWPPAEKVTYDDYEELVDRDLLEEAVSEFD